MLIAFGQSGWCKSGTRICAERIAATEARKAGTEEKGDIPTRSGAPRSRKPPSDEAFYRPALFFGEGEHMTVHDEVTFPATSDLTQPELDGQHLVTGSAEDHSGAYTVWFMPAAAYTDFEGTRHEQGEYFHFGAMFTDRHTLRTCEGPASCEYTKRPLRRDFVRGCLGRFGFRLDHLAFEWEYQPCEGFERNIFWLPGDASWMESENVRKIEELESRVAKVFRIRRADLHLPYEVGKESTRAIEDATRRVEAFEAQAQEIAELKKRIKEVFRWRLDSIIDELLTGKLTVAEACRTAEEAGRRA